MVTLVCSSCGDPFEKKQNEYDRQVRKGRTEFFCSLSCHGRKHNEVHPQKGDLARLKGGRQKDDLSPFRWFMLRIKNRPEKGPTDLTVEHLKALWEQQQGVCPLTGWPLRLPVGVVGWGSKSSPECASLDRIDNSKGYVIGNVRFVAVIANYARSDFSDADVVRFARAVVRAADLLALPSWTPKSSSMTC